MYNMTATANGLDTKFNENTTQLRKKLVNL